MKHYLLILLGLWLLLAGLPVLAQTPLTLDIENLTNAQFPQLTIDVTARENNVAVHGLGPANFTVFEDDNTDNLLTSVEELSNNKGLAISFVFDFDPTGNLALFRPMQEWSQLLLNDFNLGRNGDVSHVVEVRASSGKVLTPYTSDVIAAKNGIRQMLIEDMNNRRLNETLLDILKQNTAGRRQVIVVIGSGGDVFTVGSVIDRAIQKDAVVHTVTFSTKVDSAYMETLSVNTGGHYFNNPQNVSTANVAANLFNAFQTRYRLTYASRLNQTDTDEHVVRVTVKVNDSQAQAIGNYKFPKRGLVPVFNSLPLLWAWTVILGLTVLLLVVRLYRTA